MLIDRIMETATFMPEKIFVLLSQRIDLLTRQSRYHPSLRHTQNRWPQISACCDAFPPGHRN